MRARSRYFAALAVVVIAALAMTATACGGGDTTEGDGTADQTAEPIKVGMVVSLSGTYAGLGIPEKNVMEMEVKRINDAGGVNGRDIEVVYEDDATDNDKAVAATTKLIDQEKVVAIIGATGTGQTMAMRQQVQAAGIPQVSMAGGTAITNPVDSLVFATPWSNTIVVPFTLQKLKDAGITKVGLITDTGGFGKDGQAVLKTELPKYGMTAVADEVFNPGDADMTGQLTKIKNAGAQAILMWTAGKEAATIAKNREQLKLSIPLYGSHGIARREFIEGAGTAAEGVVFAAGKVLIPEAYGEGTDGYEVATDFIDRYTAAYGEEPNTFAGHAYDALHLIVEAAKKLPAEFTAAELRDEIEKISGWVGIGGSFTFSATDHNGLKESDLVMYEIVNGDWELAK